MNFGPCNRSLHGSLKRAHWHFVKAGIKANHIRNHRDSGLSTTESNERQSRCLKTTCHPMQPLPLFPPLDPYFFQGLQVVLWVVCSVLFRLMLTTLRNDKWLTPPSGAGNIVALYELDSQSPRMCGERIGRSQMCLPKYRIGA